MQLVAEGVETTAQAALLGAMGCDELQGYLYSRPVAPDQFAHLAGLKWALPTVLQP
jgi:EAL domain-containing protein (putative c-di-GMP-specific phosphodiesterase class I)